MVAEIKRVACGDTTTVTFKTRPAWYLAGQKFLIGAGAVILSSVITYAAANVVHWLPVQYEPIVTGILIPFLLYIKKYFSVTNEQNKTEVSENQECDNTDPQV